MQPGVGEVTIDPVRLREAAGIVQARATDVTDVTTQLRTSLAAAAAGCGGPLTAAALAAFERELNARAVDCAEALRAAGDALAQTASAAEATDRFPIGPAVAGSINEALG